MGKFGLRRALSTRPVPRQSDPQFIQEDVDEHGQPMGRRPARSNSLLGRIFRKRSRHSEDLHHSGDGLVVHPAPMHPAPSVMHGSDYEGQHSFAGAGTHLMSEPLHHDHSIRDHSARDHSVRDHSVRDHSVRDHSVHGGHIRDDRSRGYPDYASTAGHTHHGYGHDHVHEEYPPEHVVTLVRDSPPQSHVSAPREYHHVPVSSMGGTVIHEIHDGRSTSGRSGRSPRSPQPREVEVNLMPGEKQEFEIGPNTQLIVPDDVELEISDGKGGWLPYHESLLRRPPREEIYVISGGSNFIVEDEMGNILHRSQPATYSAAPVSVAGSVTGRSTRSRRDDATVYVDG